MILCVSLNPALDITYEVPALVAGTSHRVEVTGYRAGGKAFNVARVLHQLGEPVRATGLLGGSTGSTITSDLSAAGIDTRPILLRRESRRSVTVVATDDDVDTDNPDNATVLNEPGPQVEPSEWRQFTAAFSDLLPDADVVVLSGSLPPGVPVTAYRDLSAGARERGVKVLLDTTGEALRVALPTAPDIAKPNAIELGQLLNRALRDNDDVLEAARSVLSWGAQAVVVSRASEGLVAARPDQALLLHAPVRVRGNPTGAGDALSAVLARGLRRGEDWTTCLTEAVASATASVTVGVAGATDLELAARLLPRVVAEELK